MSQAVIDGNGHASPEPPDVFENWSSIEQAAVNLADQIEAHCVETGERFDKVVLIPRGAYGVANIVARRFEFTAVDMLHMCIESRQKDHSQGGFKYGQMPLPAEVEGLDLLMLDEVGDSNKTAKHAKGLLLLAGARLVRSGTLHDKVDATPPEYADFVWDWIGTPPVRGQPWIHYPWEKHEEVGKTSVVKRR